MAESNTIELVEVYSNIGSLPCDEPIELLQNAETVSFKNSVINSLNRWVPDTKTGNYFTLGAFQESLSLWENVPIVFAEQHPNPSLFTQNPEAALKQVNGIIVGQATNARIVVEGHPRLLQALSINNPKALQLWKEGRLSLSSAFFAYRNAERRITKIESVNHILIFEETETDTPRDKSTIIQNKSGESKMADLDDIKKMIADLPAKIGEALANKAKPVENADHTHSIQLGIVPVHKTEQKPSEDSHMANDTEKFDALNKELEDTKATVASLNKEIDAKKAEIAELNKQLEAKDKIIESYMQKEKDAKFAVFLNTLKPGAYDTDEKKAELRNKFESDPQNLMVKLATEGMFAVKVEENKTGEEHVAEENTDNASSGLNWNAITRKWE